MTKIKILLGFSACFAVINLIHLAMQVIYLGFGISNWLIKSVLSFIILLGTISICIALFRILKSGYFNMKTSKSFRVGGLLLCFVAVLDIIRAVLDMTAINRLGYLANAITIDVLLFLMGFGILTISQIIKKGIVLKQENDLTI